jgi:hypothetical protein
LSDSQLTKEHRSTQVSSKERLRTLAELKDLAISMRTIGMQFQALIVDRAIGLIEGPTVEPSVDPVAPVAQRQWIEGSDASNLGWWDYDEIDAATCLREGYEPLYARDALRAVQPPRADIEALLESFVWAVRRDNDNGDQYTRQEVKDLRAELLAAIRAVQPPLVARPKSEYHEDMGDVLWWHFPIVEPPWVGSTLESQWALVEKHVTHWTPLPIPTVTKSAESP